jgi:hypothetical protein
MLAPVGECIYCGAKDQPLHEEHIIPEAIGGGLVLPSATCRCGLERTHGFEGRVTNQIFQDIRRQMGIKGKKRKRHPDELRKLPIQESFADPIHLAPARKVELKDHPSTLIIPRIQPLSALGKNQLLSQMDGKQVPIDFWILVPDAKERADRLKKEGAKGVWQLKQIEINLILRLLAKMAHASAVATMGPRRFKYQLIDVISGKMEGANSLIGELPAEAQGLLPPALCRFGLHQIAVGHYDYNSSRQVLVHMHLFSGLFRPQPPFTTPHCAVLAGAIIQ